jgi:GntR family transcriptional regulator
MFFSIDANNGVAIYEQLMRQVKFAIAEGSLRPGQLLPSVRAISVELALNPNTVAKALHQLQLEGIIDSLRGKGLVVAANAIETCKVARRNLLSERLRSVLQEAMHSGLAVSEIERMFQEQLAHLSKKKTKTISSSPTEKTKGSDR